MSYRLSFIKFMVTLWVFLNVINNGLGATIAEKNCVDGASKSYCLDCLTYAVCLLTEGYLPVFSTDPQNYVCVESEKTASFGPVIDVGYCTCSSFPSAVDDKYDPNDKFFVCTATGADPFIECKHGYTLNTTTYTCDSPTIDPSSTLPIDPSSTPPPQECNNGLEFICLGCDFYQLCRGDGTSQIHACELGSQCNLPAKQCVPATSTAFECKLGTPGFQEDPNDCSACYYCDGTDETPLFSQSCPDGEIFNSLDQACTINEDKWAICSYDCSSAPTTNAPKSTTSTTETTTTTGSITNVATTTPKPGTTSTASPSPSPCPCSPTVRTCVIDCKNYYYCYEDPPGTYTPIEKSCPYDFNFNPTDEKCELGPCVIPNDVPYTNHL